jgi:tetratricopeptide (TPR) repeat protein
VLDRVSKGFLTIAVAAVAAFLPLPSQGQDAAQTPAAQASPWKDRAEYDLYQAITKEQDAAKRVALLSSWKEKYPTSTFKPQRDLLFVISHAQANQAQKTLDAAKDAFSEPPKETTQLYISALYYTLLATRGTSPTPDNFSIGEKASNSLLNAGKPTDVKEEDWNKAKTNIYADAHATLGWIALQKKDNEAAEKEFTECLKLNPNYAQVSAWLGTAVVAEKKPEKQSEALFDFARAASLDQAHGGLAAAEQKAVDTYFVNAFNRFHGQDPQLLQQIRDLAKAQPFPPADFKIENIEEVKVKHEEEFKKQNPAMALWMNLKAALTAADGQQYFDANMKGAEVPGGAGGVQTFKGKLISSKPALHPKQLVLSISDGTTPDVTLNLDAALPGKADPGVEVEFAGVPSAFVKDPFMVTFDVEKKKILGWPGKDAPAPRHHTTKKSG